MIHTAGHTPGSIAFLVGNYLFSGDTLLSNGPGVSDTAAGLTKILNSITGKLFTLPDNTHVLPGHGKPTTIKKAKAQYAEFKSRDQDRNLYGFISWDM